MSHSKTPWRQVDTTIEDADGYLILDCRFGSKEDCEANAKRIAHCVNHYGPLLAAAKQALEECVDLISTPAGDALADAIARAEAQS